MDEKKMKELLKRAHSSQQAPPFEIVWRQAVRSSSSPSQGRSASPWVRWSALGLAGAAAAVALLLFVSVDAPAPSAPLESGAPIAARAPSNDSVTATASGIDALVASLKDLEVYEDYAWSEREQEDFDENDNSVLAAASDSALDFEGLFDESPTDFLLEIDFGQGEDEERNLL